MNTPKSLLLTTEHKEKLEKLVKSGMTPAIIVQRAKILLFKADGRSNDSDADELGITREPFSFGPRSIVTVLPMEHWMIS